jgi:hypothetical protein
VRRIPIQLDETAYQALKARAFREHRSIADLIRESIALNQRNVPPRSIDDFSFIGSGSAPSDRTDRTSERHDEALAQALAPRRAKRK